MPYLPVYEYVVFSGLTFEELRTGAYDLAEIYKNEYWNQASPAMDLKVAACEDEGETEAYFKPALTAARVWTRFDSELCLCFYSKKAPQDRPCPVIFFRKIATLPLKCELLAEDEGGTYDVKFTYLISGNEFYTLRDIPKACGWLAVQYLVKEEKQMQCNTRMHIVDLPQLTSRFNFFKALNDAAASAVSASAVSASQSVHRSRKRPAAASQDVLARVARASGPA